MPPKVKSGSAAKGKKVMKKPAAKAAKAKAKASAKAKAKAKPQATAGSATRKRPAASSSQVTQKRRKIVQAIKGMEELPKDVREMLTGLVDSLGAKDGQIHPLHVSASTMLGDALADTEGKLKGLLTAARAKVNGAAADKEARAEALQAAEDNLPLLKEALADKKAAVTVAGKAIQAAQRDVQVCKAETKTATSALKEHTKKMDHLKQTEEESYGALKEAAALGSQGQKQLKTLRRVGREFGFHEVLLEALPAILKKQPDRRRTFDNSALTHLESEFQKRACKIDTDIKSHQAALDAKEAAVKAAEEAVAFAEEQKTASLEELAAAEAGLAAGKQALKDARKQHQHFDSDSLRAVRELSRIEARYHAFATGPLAAFQDIQGQQAMELSGANGQSQASKSASASTKIEGAVAVPMRADSQGTATVVTSAAPDTLAEVIATLPHAAKDVPPTVAAQVQEAHGAIWP
mmetsp:Transcript_41314/g.74694  ORF Transcript_41314/g.74694 Transcript_41314/m.74694 type:complete len:464 (-) Transcript_41314:240-1631(-)